MNDSMRPRLRRCGPARHFVGGAILVVLGLLFLLDNLRILRADQFIGPAIMIVIGAGLLSTPWSQGRSLVGGMLIVGGSLLALSNAGVIERHVWGVIWPMAIVALGVLLLFRAVRRPVHSGPWWWREGGPYPPQGWVHKKPNENPNFLEVNAVFGGVQQRVEVQECEGGEVAAVFGNVELDLRTMGTTKDQLEMEVNAVFGKVEVWVPQNWNIRVTGTGVFGAYEDKTLPARLAPGEKRPTLILRGGAVFGNVLVKN